MRPQPEYSLDDLLAEPRTVVPQLTRDDAVRLGEIALSVIREWERDLAVDVRVGDELAFRAQIGSTGQGNADIMARKIVTARHFGHSSLLARYKRDADPSVAEGLGDEYAFWGGAIPIFSPDDEIIGTISSSGEPDVVDHEAISEALRRWTSSADGAPAAAH